MYSYLLSEFLLFIEVLREIRICHIQDRIIYVCIGLGHFDIYLL